MTANVVVTFGIDDNQMSTPVNVDIENDLPTEEEINEWIRRSRKEGICGIVSCFNKPTTRCKKCTTYYCSEHFPPHFDLLPDGDFGCNNNNTSSNEGLERYMEDESNDFSSNDDLDAYMD